MDGKGAGVTADIAGLDHLLIGVGDLEAARETYARLGFTATPRGRHIGWGTANYCLMFPEDYLELIGVVDASQFTNNLDSFLAQYGDGLLGAAFAGGDLSALAGRLGKLGLECEGPRELKRILELPEGEVRPEFELLYTPPEATPGLRAFVCRHLTPGIVWQTPWLSHPNGARRVDGLTVVVENPGSIAAAYADLFGVDALDATDNLVTVRCGTCRLRFTDAQGLRTRHPQAGPEQPETGPAAMEVAVADLGTAARRLETQGVAFERGREGRLHVPAKEACGVLLDFVQA